MPHRVVHGTLGTVTTPGSWDEAYSGEAPPPWDIGRPQPAFARLADQGLLAGRVLDSGCGTGENTLLAAAHGADRLGVDLSARAIARARAKAAERGLAGPFETGDVLRLGDLGLTFDTIIDSGVFHVFDDEDRARYVASLAVGAEPGRPLLPDLLQRPPARGVRAAPGEPGRAARRLRRRVVRRQHRGRDLRAQPGLVGIPSAQAWLAVIQRLG